MNKIILVLYGQPRPSMPTLAGRSGRQYSRAVFNAKEQRHETQPFEIEYFNTVMLPDLAKMAGFGLLSWLPYIVTETEAPKEEPKVEPLVPDLTDAFKDLEQEAPAATEEAPAETPAVSEYASKTFRELREIARAKGLKVSNVAKKEDIIAMLSEPVPA